ncbi:methionine ABC transporter permease [Paenibacillus sp. UMB4589-SE434]|uniref:methionine ABC transporter permease n=1 Tax=Paenibacillus sp. UMB4589-SE434 TaxID=3046314 RepID=UPI00254DB886|nr:methionine ABC transporter permease [Paenibacillus sp. UMB4589-SE434]MDK8183902.1 methionine ABC transporter permease [Paenibacillus sp. UMB4589-SE434]
MVFGIDFSEVNWSEVSQASADTLNMLGFSVLFTFIIGLPLGVLLFLSGKSSHWFVKVMYSLLSLMVNVLRSVPFVILMIAILPFTKVLIGTTIGVKGAIPALVIAAAPFFARLVETSLREVDRGVIEAAQAMGASTWQIVRKVLLPEAMPGLIAGTTITAVTLISYTAMSGLVGGGGLGDLAIRYGYQRYETSVMIIAIAVMIVMVQILQWIGDRFVRHYTRK